MVGDIKEAVRGASLFNLFFKDLKLSATTEKEKKMSCWNKSKRN
jgi:hypothetical protein